MRKFYNNEEGQIILSGCMTIVVAIILMTTYTYSILWTGEGSIDTENRDSFYYYNSIKDNYLNMPSNIDNNNVTIYENQLKDFALLHGYSLNFLHKDVNFNKNTTIIFTDKDIKIIEKLKGG